MELCFPSRMLTRFSAMILLTAAVALFSPAAPAQTYKVLYAFTGGADGGEPGGGVVLDKAGNLYGSTLLGGTAGCYGGTCGVAFELSPGPHGWTDATLHTFSGGADGGNAGNPLLRDPAGNLYGTTNVGGMGQCSPFGCGVAFELSPGSQGWTESVLHTFNGADGGSLQAGFTAGKPGHLYSASPLGGSSGGGAQFLNWYEEPAAGSTSLYTISSATLRSILGQKHPPARFLMQRETYTVRTLATRTRMVWCTSW